MAMTASEITSLGITSQLKLTQGNLPAAGVPEEERVLGIWGSRNLELCPKKKA